MKKTKSRRPWLPPALIAVILFLGNLASNLVAGDLQPVIGPYRRVVWVVCALALVVTFVVAIINSQRDDPPSTDKSRAAIVTGERGVAIAGNVENSPITTGDDNVIGNKIGGDSFTGNKTVNINQVTSAAINALHQLRAPVGDFVGRKQEIETLVQALRNGSHVGINGMGGIGKTELALLVAERVASVYPEAQFFINLQGTDANQRSPDEVLAMCIRAFIGAEATLPEDRDQLLQRYRGALSGKRVLLLLDNAADSGQVQPLLPPPGSVVLVTSRQPVTLPGIIRHKLNPLTDEEARELLLEIAPHAEPAAAQICELCGYLPLAIRAAGSLLAITDDLDPMVYATQLKDERKRFEYIGKEGVEIDVAASFNLSYERLSPEAALIFRMLSVFPSTFDASAEEAVCDDAGHKRLSDLVKRNLVLYDSDTKRYRLHDLARLFADSKLTDEERAIVHKRHARYFKDVLAAARKLYQKGADALVRGLMLLDLEWSNIQAGHAWGAEQRADTDEDVVQLAMAYVDAGSVLLQLRLHVREHIEWLELALAAARRLKNRGSEGTALGSLGVAHWNLGENERAIRFLEQYLTISRETGNRHGEGAALGNLGNVYKDLGEKQRAIEFYEQALSIAREVGDRRFQSTALGSLGVVYANLGETRRAIEFYEQALTLAREIGDRRGEAVTMGNLGNVYADLGESQRALQFYEQQLTIVHEIGDLRGEGLALWNLSVELYQLGWRAQAIHNGEQALAILEQVEDPSAAKVRVPLALWREETNTTL